MYGNIDLALKEKFNRKIFIIPYTRSKYSFILFFFLCIHYICFLWFSFYIICIVPIESNPQAYTPNAARFRSYSLTPSLIQSSIVSTHKRYSGGKTLWHLKHFMCQMTNNKIFEGKLIWKNEGKWRCLNVKYNIVKIKSKTEKKNSLHSARAGQKQPLD